MEALPRMALPKQRLTDCIGTGPFSSRNIIFNGIWERTPPQVVANTSTDCVDLPVTRVKPWRNMYLVLKNAHRGCPCLLTTLSLGILPHRTLSKTKTWTVLGVRYVQLVRSNPARFLL